MPPEKGQLVGEQFLHWFLQERREEVSSMSDLLAIVERGKDDLLLVKEYLAGGAGKRARSRLALRRLRAALSSPALDDLAGQQLTALQSGSADAGGSAFGGAERLRGREPRSAPG